MAPPTRIVMLGTGDFALPTFVHLCDTGHHVERAGHPARPSPGTKAGADPQRDQAGRTARGIPVDQPEDVNAPESLDASARSGPTCW